MAQALETGLTSYWAKMVQEADRLLTKEIAELSQAPKGSWDALERDSDVSILERVRAGGLCAKMWALNIVARDNIASVFRIG